IISAALWFPPHVIFRSVQVFRNSRILHRYAETESFARPDISTKIKNVIVSQLPEIIRWENNRVCDASVKCWLANTRRIFRREIEQQAQRRNVNVRLVARWSAPEKVAGRFSQR